MVSLYDMSVPVYIRSLENLLTVLKAGEKWADENQVAHSKLIEARLAPDMHVWIATTITLRFGVLTRPFVERTSYSRSKQQATPPSKLDSPSKYPRSDAN